MKKAIGAALVILAALSLLLFLSGPIWPDNTISDNRSYPSSEINISGTELNGSNDAPVAEMEYNSDYPASGPEGGENTFFQDIGSGALGLGEYVRYDEDTLTIYPGVGDERNDISLSVDRARFMDRIYVKDLYSGDDYTVSPPEGFNFLLVSVTAAPVGEYLDRYNTPMTWDFRIVDSSGNFSPLLKILENAGVVITNDISLDTMVNERFVIRNVGDIYVGETIFSSLNDVAGSGPVSGWIIYEVPDDFSLSSGAFMELTLGDQKLYWKLHDIMVDLRVGKNPDTGTILVSYGGGPEGYLIRAIEAELVKADGSIDIKSASFSEEEDYLAETEILFTGTAGELDFLTVKVMRLDGEEFVKFQKSV